MQKQIIAALLLCILFLIYLYKYRTIENFDIDNRLHTNAMHLFDQTNGAITYTEFKNELNDPSIDNIVYVDLKAEWARSHTT